MATLIITLGTRELQPLLQAGQSGVFINIPHGTKNGIMSFDPFRDACLAIQKNVEAYLPHLQYPIAKAAIEYIVANYNTLEIVWICTHQPEIVHQSAGDSFAAIPILESLIKRDFPSLSFKSQIIEINCNPTIHEKVEVELSTKWPTLAYPDIYLYAQSGIGPANFILQLICLEHYPHLRMLIKPEGKQVALESKMPQRFRTNYFKQSIRAALNDYRYSDIVASGYTPEVTYLASFAANCLSFNFQQAQKDLNYLRSTFQDIAFYEELWSFLQAVKTEANIQFMLAYLTAKYNYQQKDYAGFLIRLFALSENILHPAVEKILNANPSFDSTNQYTEWKSTIERNPSFIDFCKKSRRFPGGVTAHKPGFHCFVEALKWHQEQQKEEHSFLKVANDFDQLRDLRNKIAHQLAGVTDHDIEKCLPNPNKQNGGTNPSSNTDRFFNSMKGYFYSEKTCKKYYDIFDRINIRLNELV